MGLRAYAAAIATLVDFGSVASVAGVAEAEVVSGECGVLDGAPGCRDPLSSARESSCVHRSGTWQSPGAVEAVHLRKLGDFRFPGGLRCPLVIKGLSEASGWRNLARLGDLRELERRTSASVTFDASPNGEFVYWDNNTVLAAEVQRVGVLRQGYAKVTASRRAFFSALAKGRKSKLGSVRFGGSMSELSRDLANSVGSAIPELTIKGGSPPSIWLSTAGSSSTAHYDSFHNIFIMLGGEKTVLLSPSVDATLFRVHPGTHPLARQARKHFGRADALGEVATAARVLSATLQGGEAVFIPAGWLHHVTALSTAVSVSLTALPPEHDAFNSWMVEGGASVLPFMASGGWTTRRLAAALRVFVPALLQRVDFGGAAWPAGGPLDALVNSSYGLETRSELALPAELPLFKPCGKASAADKRAADAAATEVAKRLNGFPQELRSLYIMPYLETALSMVAGGETEPARIMHRTMGFVQTCLKVKP